MRVLITLIALLNFGMFYGQSDTFKIKETSGFDISTLNYNGEVVHSKFWQDTNGKNIVLFTSTKEELFVFHYTIKNDNATLLRRVNDLEKNCEFDLTLNFIKSSIAVTDLDNDNYGEITFAYVKTCTSDVSPKTLKLLTLENGDKYIIRGSTKIDWGKGNISGGEKNIHFSFKKGPSVFLSNANKIWKKLMEEYTLRFG